MPSRLGTKIMSIGAVLAICWESCPASLGGSMVVRPRDFAASRLTACRAGSVGAAHHTIPMGFLLHLFDVQFDKGCQRPCQSQVIMMPMAVQFFAFGALWLLSTAILSTL